MTTLMPRILLLFHLLTRHGNALLAATLSALSAVIEVVLAPPPHYYCFCFCSPLCLSSVTHKLALIVAASLIMRAFL
eukprot:CAMPEP_0201693936 /NCGR_PEP_ID=MMETSP0578-20130828/6374_1 /ASSEMBLY_ACC=CAM_ASM_000663 /TAXON_ID=267565 /ORGANISM="Skeletonema grethea, Strain CCMP 1804" /LENGTH=76 /DNA_ID=CAMNT_0048179545 /DNA_START=57 /DNA_END=283 /DNA_ORIENTATION=+